MLPPVLLTAVSAVTPALAADAAGAPPADTVSMSVIYGVLTFIALAMLAAYCIVVKKKTVWFILLYSCVTVVNLGYLAMSVSGTLEEALLANRISYFGSAYLPLCMLMILVDTCRIRPKKIVIAALIVISTAIFLLAASGGYLKLYYSDVSIVYVNGAARLSKIYGPLHDLYLVYLLLYFALMIAVILYAAVRKHVSRPIHALLLAAIVLGNIGVWLIEQIVTVDFEFLSISYIISEVFLLLLYWMLQEYDLLQTGESPAPPEQEETLHTHTLYEQFLAVCPESQTLTARELEVIGYILENRKRREIADIMCVSENTVKKHTSHIFAKLGITSRSELFAQLTADSKTEG